MKLHIIIAILLMACTAAWADKNVEAIKKAEGKSHVSGKRWAVVVGVNNYDDERINDLAFAASDARLMAATLEQSGLFERVYLFADGQSGAEPTLKNVLGKIKTVAQGAGADDMILFYFSGHGFPDEKEGLNYLAVKDTDPDLLQKFGIGLNEVYRFFNDSRARSKVVLLDACHSGARKDKGNDLYLTGNYLYNGKGSVTISSSQFEQSSWEWPEKGNGVFTYFLSQGMTGLADAAPYGNGDGVVVSYELEQYVTDAVQNWGMDHNRSQTPRGKRNMTGDVVLGLAGGAVAQPPPTENMRAEKRCVGNDLYWYGDRGSRGDRIGACTANSTCSAGQCICNSGYEARDGQCVTAITQKSGMVHIPAGSFMMGCSSGDSECDDDEKPAKKVTLTKGFYMDATEVTQGEYERVMGKNPSYFQSCGADCPVEQVSWNDAKAYCEKVGKRLPTEAEWEYAARGGSSTAYYWGKSIDGAYAWYSDNSGSKTHAVGQKKANGFGLYDMAGNVWEWVADCYDSDWYSKMPATNPVNTCTGSGNRVLRGGSWNYYAWSTRVSYRLRNLPDYRYDYVGFRCAQDF